MRTFLEKKENHKGGSIRYRVELLSLEQTSSDANDDFHCCGGALRGDIDVIACPNCSCPIFPVFQFSLNDRRIRTIVDWQFQFIHLVVCQNCCLYLAPYWLCYSSKGVEIIGGYRDDGEGIGLESHYDARKIRIRKLMEDDYPSTIEELEYFPSRLEWPGAFHQLGGCPYSTHDGRTGRVYTSLDCIKCGDKMFFGGIIDSDNTGLMPLYLTGHIQSALIFGDDFQMYFSFCERCSVIGFQCIKPFYEPFEQE